MDKLLIQLKGCTPGELISLYLEAKGGNPDYHDYLPVPLCNTLEELEESLMVAAIVAEHGENASHVMRKMAEQKIKEAEALDKLIQ